MTADFAIVPAGDAVLLVEFAARLDAAINARVVWMAEEVRRSRTAGVLDVVPAFHSLAVYFDPLRTDANRLTTLLKAAASASRDVTMPLATPRQVPVCYGGIYGPDLEAIAETTAMTADEIITLHAAPVYRVFMVGFTPGFAYMGPVDPRIAVPRRPTPRVRVPVGSVGIAGSQTGIYPSETPGGWMLIGRTPLRPFQPTRPEPFILEPGDAVQFVPITADTYRRLTGASEGGRGAWEPGEPWDR